MADAINFKVLKKQALLLPRKQQHELVESLDALFQADYERKCDEASGRRLARRKSGEAAGVPLAEVMVELKKLCEDVHG